MGRWKYSLGGVVYCNQELCEISWTSIIFASEQKRGLLMDFCEIELLVRWSEWLAWVSEFPTLPDIPQLVVNSTQIEMRSSG